MGHTYVWKGGSGSLSVAADWTDQSTGGTALAAPGTADTALLVGATAGLLLASGALDVAALVTSFGVALSGRVSAGTVTDTGTLVLEAGASLQVGGATVSGTLAADGTGALLQVAGTLVLSGAADAVGGGTLSIGALALAGGTLSLDALSLADVGGGAGGAGTLAVAVGAAITGSGALHDDAGTIALAGTIAASAGALGLFGAVAGSGTLAIGAGATLFAADAVGAGLIAAFAPPSGGAGGTLELFGAGATFGATILGFVAGDAIDIAADTIATAAWASGVLTLTDTAGTALALALPDGAGQSYDAATFIPLPDGLGGTAVVVAPAPTTAPSGNIAYTVAAGAFQLFAATSTVSRLVVAGTLAVTAHTASNTISIAGTLAATGRSGFFSGPSASVSGLLIADGPRARVLVTGNVALSGSLAATSGGTVSLGTVTLAGGQLMVDPTSVMVIGGATNETGEIAVAAGSTLGGWGQVAGSLDDAGLLLVQGGALALDAPAGGSGAVQIGTGGTLVVFSTLALPVAFAAGATLEFVGDPGLVTGTLGGFGSGDVLDFAGIRIDGATWSGGTLSLTSGATIAGTIALAGSYSGQSWQTAADGVGGTLVALGSGGGQPLSIRGTLAVASSIAAPSATANAGALVSMQGGTLAVATLQVNGTARLTGEGMIGGALANAGTITASGGALVVAGPISGAGGATIAATGILFAEAGFSGAISVTFQGQGGTLVLFGDARAAPGAVSGFAGGDALDIAGADVLSASWAATGGGIGTLDLSGPAGDLGSVTLAGDYTGTSFIVSPDGGGGTVISPVGGNGGGPNAPVPCFAAGTCIATPGGEVQVETLRPGDLVVTPSGPRPLRWVGHRRCDIRAVPEARPVRIEAGALARLLGAALPLRDLLLSPQHALLLRGVLVPAVALVGGAKIRREAVETIAYHHLGLDAHATVLAEGVPAETYLPLAASAWFDAEFGTRPLPGRSCAPRLEGGAGLATLRRALVPRARRAAAPGALRGHLERTIETCDATRLEGWAVDDAAPVRPVRLDVLRHGRRVGIAIANRWRPDLDRAGLAGGCCAFEIDLPGPPGPLLLRRRPDGAPLPFLEPAANAARASVCLNGRGSEATPPAPPRRCAN